MNIRQRAEFVAQLIRHEELKLKPYVDTVGKVTIGVGRNLTDNGITHDEALVLLDHDIDTASFDLQTFGWYRELDPIRQRVVLDMRFNLGPTRFRTFKNTILAIERGDYTQAARNMLDSRWAEQVGQRAITLAKMMETGKV